MNNKGRSTTGKGMPYHPRSAPIETALHLRLMVTRWLGDRASVSDIEEAYRMWRESNPT